MWIQTILTYPQITKETLGTNKRTTGNVYHILGIRGISIIPNRVYTVLHPDMTEERRKYLLDEVEKGNLPLKNKWVASCVLWLRNMQESIWTNWMRNERYIKYLNAASENILWKIIQKLQIETVEAFERDVLKNPSMMNILRISHEEKWKNGYLFPYYEKEDEEAWLRQYPHFHLSSEEKQKEIFRQNLHQTDQKNNDLYEWETLQILQEDTRIPKIGVCSWAEPAFIESLWWYRILGVYVTCGWKVIWHIKYGNENSFISYVDVWETLKKWGIYSVYKWSMICQRFLPLWVYNTDWIWLRYMRASRFTPEELDLLINISMKKYRKNYIKNPS